MKISFSEYLTGLDKFLRIINKYTEDFVLKHDKFEVDAKSLLGIMSLDLTQVLTLEPKSTISQETENKIVAELKENNLLVE